MKILAYKQGSFSLVNDQLSSALATALPDAEFRWLDVVDDFVLKNSSLRLIATGEAILRYPRLIKQGISPSALFPRCSAFLTAFPQWVREQEEAFSPDLTFQTQSLFRASMGRVPHFGYTDHTLHASRRYAKAGPQPRYSSAWREMEVVLYRESAITFTTSRFAADSIIEDYGVLPSHVACVFSGINVAFPEAVPTRTEAPARILFIGVEWERKGGPELLAAFLELRKTFPLAELHIVGCHPAVSEPSVFIHGKLPPSEVPTHLARATIFCMPSRVEPSAVALVEAAAYGLPVVSTLTGGNPDRVIDGETGLLVPVQDSVALAAALKKLMADPALARQMGERGRAHARAHFTWPAVAGKIATAIRSNPAFS